ncbi:MAG TPA: glycosyltransferase, partial [Candidatus Hydrogenedentes bacterium]|nr:glycosyltransferase [Candidatus Hydrogenedentota bacterium]
MIGSGVAGSTMPTVDFLSRAHTTNQDRAAAVRHALDRARYAAWLEALAAAMTAFEQHRWARLGFSLRMMPRTDALNNARAAFARFESALAQDLAKPTQDAADLDAGDAAVTASARECLTLFGACLDAWDRGPWWRLGVMLRRVAGRLRLAKAEFHLPSEDARVVLDEAALWDCVAVEDLAAAGWQDGAAAALTRFQAHCRDTLFAERLSDIAARTNSVALRARLDATPGVLAPLMARTWTPGAEPLVSVIMPTFNRAALLPDAVRSVRDQTWPHWELLVCDDGGTDDSAAVVAAIGDPRVRWISLRHEGAAAARNAGLARAHGEYVAYLDSDNLWHPAYLEVMCNVMADRPAAMAAYADYTDVTLGGEAGPRLRPWPPRAFSYERLARHNFIDLNTFFHRLALTETLGSFTADLPKLQDWDLLLRYLFRESPIFVDLPLALYVRNPAVAQISQQRRLNARTTASIRARRRACYDAAVARHDRREDRALAVLAFASDKDAAQKAYAVVRAKASTASAR